MAIFPMHRISPFSRYPRSFFRRRTLVLTLALLCTTALTARGSSLIYKNYIVRYDRGWDILCEPYVVQTGDWVLKIFRQKGEIAHKDFREFLGIFQRLNPQVADIDMVRPGQTIDIPLRKLEHGSLPGQSSGTVTIPFVRLAKVIDVLHQNMQVYPVQRGDTISKLVAAHFGRYGSRGYNEGIELLQAANPQITDLDRIYAGQTIYLPDPSIREKEWYASLYDEKGDMRQTVNLNRTAAAATDRQAEGRRAPLPPAADRDRQPQAPADALAAAAAAIGGRLMNKGTYFVPRPGQDDFEIDLSRYPLLQMPSAPLLFSPDGRIMDRPAAAVQAAWPEVKLVAYDDRASVGQMVGAIFQALDGDAAPAAAETGFEDRGTLIRVRAKWMRPESDQRRICITPIDGVNEQTPESVRRYLEQHGIVLREIPPGGHAPAASPGPTVERHAVKDILAIAASGQKDFVRRLVHALHFSYAPNVTVSFPYAGMQIQAYANLVSSGDGHEVLVDFGDIYGDALKALRQSGQNIVQIAADEGSTAIVGKLLGGLGVPVMDNPTFLAAPRPAEYNTSITVPGVLLTGPPGKRTLLCGAPLHPAVTDVLSARGVAVVTW